MLRCRLFCFADVVDFFLSCFFLGGGLISPRNIGGPKTSKFGTNFGQLRTVIAIISGTKHDVVERKTALQTAISPAHNAINSVNFGAQTAKNRAGV